MSDERKPCPLCGSGTDMYITMEHNQKAYFVMCNNTCCKCRTRCFADEVTAIKAWNRRAKNQFER